MAVTAYLLGTGSHADALAVAMGPIDTAELRPHQQPRLRLRADAHGARGHERAALFHQLTRCFLWSFPPRSRGAVILARAAADARARARPRPALLRDRRHDPADPVALHGRRRRGRDPGGAALYRAPFRADRVLSGGAERLHHRMRAGAVEVPGRLRVRGRLYRRARGCNSRSSGSPRGRRLGAREAAECRRSAGANSSPSRHSSSSTRPDSGPTSFSPAPMRRMPDPGMAAALDYCMRGVGVPLAILVSPISNSLLPELARRDPARRLTADR